LGNYSYSLVLHNDTVVLLLEPLDSVCLAHSVVDTKRALGDLLLGDTTTWSGNLDIEVHTVDTSAWIVLDTQIDVLLDTESETTLGPEVLLLELVFLDLETLLEDFFGLLTSNGHVASNLVVTADTERSNGISG
jgi:hypothetical protein